MMRDVLADIQNWQTNGRSIALATVVKTWGSAPRGVGAKMACTAVNQISGSVSGGCIEGAVVEAGKEVLTSGTPQLLHFGVADETAWEVGLACGGEITVFVERLDTAVFPFLRDHIHQQQACTVVTALSGPRQGQKFAFDRQGQTVGDQSGLETAVAQAQNATHSHLLTLPDGEQAFIDLLRPAPLLLLIGGAHIAIPLAAMAKTLDYRVAVIDPRRAFGSAERFPHADALHQQWPQKVLPELDLGPETAVALLSHDPKIDDPALKLLLHSDVGYIGALGSRKTHAKRVTRLREMGFDDDAIARIHAPIGLDIAAQTPAEIALAVMAEIVETRNVKRQNVKRQTSIDA